MSSYVYSVLSLSSYSGRLDVAERMNATRILDNPRYLSFRLHIVDVGRTQLTNDVTSLGRFVADRSFH